MSNLDEQAQRLEAAVQAILDLRSRLDAGAPWAMAELYGTEDEASWGPPELLAHLDEMLPFWLGEVERILDGQPAAPVPFGRIASDPVRIAVIGRDRTVPLKELLARLRADCARVAGWMRDLSPADADRAGLHPTRGVLTVSEILERMVTGHMEDHVNQLRDILAARGV